MIMRKLYLMLVMHCALCIMHCLYAQDKTIILFEDFEDGIPTTWSQEQIIGNYDWVIESGDLKNPEGAVSGTKRVAFRNNSNQTTAYVTRLILPEMNLAKIFQPILCFSYAQEKWAGDFDTLKIMYRRTPKSNWVTLKTYDTYSSGWQRDTIRLAAVTSTYQLAFEAKDNLGRGIVLDDIEVRSVPNCAQPFNLTVGKIAGTSVSVEWAGSFDALNYNVRVSNKPLSVSQLLGVEQTDAEIKDYKVDGAEYSFEVTGLYPATEYYFYVQSECVGENSDWSDGCYFKTSDMLMLPYYEDFNMDYIENTTSSVENWFAYSSRRSAVPPFVNTHQTRSSRLKYSPDSTTALFFQGALNTETAIGKGAYSYACLPEIYIDSVKRLQLSFWTINYVTDGLVPIGEACRMLVGVMSDPSNKKTFVAVDTIEIKSVADFEEVMVSFENYEGDGKYITFMSEFKDATNAFVIDNLLLEEIPTTPKANIKVGLPSSETLEVKFLEEESAQYEVLVSNVLLKTSNIDNKKVVAREVFNSAPCRIEGLFPWVTYYVYGRHVNLNDTGAWSNPVQVLMPEKFYSYPTTVTFDINSFDFASYYNPGKSTYKLANGLLTLSNNSVFPESTEQWWEKEARSQWELHMEIRKKGDYQMIIFPEMINPKQTKISFYATRHLVEPATFVVGIMSDANDVDAFQPLDTITIATVSKRNYLSFAYDLSQYKFDGCFFAIKLDYEYTNAWSHLWIDDVRFYENKACAEPTEIKEVVEEDKVTISWKNNGASSWNVLVAAKEYSADDIDILTREQYFTKQTTNTNSITISGLNTGEKTYYYYVQSNCGGELSIWSLPQSFKTACRQAENIPYTMDFDDPEWLVDASNRGFPIPCLNTIQTSYVDNSIDVTYYYPHLSNTVKFTGEKSLVLGYSSCVVFPKLNAELNNLQIAFSMLADSVTHAVEVGIMAEPSDISTFEVVDTIKPNTSWSKHIVKFKSYVGSGKHIAIRAMGATNMNYIDNVIISLASNDDEGGNEGGDDEGGEDTPPVGNSCSTPRNFSVSNVTKQTATISWNSTAGIYNLVVSSRELAEEEYINAVVGNDVLVVEKNYTQLSYNLSGLKANRPYHFYVQAICSDTTQSDWAVGHFYTECTTIDVNELLVESFDYYGVGEGTKPNCYIVGSLTKDALLANIPHCSDEYSHSGSASLMLKSTITNNGAYAITPEIDVDNISRLRVKFHASVGNYASSQYARELIVAIITDPNNVATKVDIDTLKIQPGEGLDYEVRFDEYIGDWNDDFGRYVMFLSESTKSNVVFVDDVVIDVIPECAAPKVREISSDANSIRLQLYGGQAPYKVKYVVGENSQEAFEAALVETITDGNLEIKGLTPNTECYIIVSSSCENAEWSPIMCFSTAQIAVADLPYYDSFSQNRYAGEYFNPLDWTGYYIVDDNEEQYRYPAVLLDNGANKVAYLYAKDATSATYLVSPQLNVSSLSQCQVSFKYKPDVETVKSQRAIIVGVVSNVSTRAKIEETFEPVDTLLVNGTLQYDHIVVSLSNYTGVGKHVAFKSDYTLNRVKVTDKGGAMGGFYLDDVLVELQPSCQRPTDFRLKALGDTYAEFVFSHESAIKYDVKYGISGFDVETAGTSISITDTTFVINGLQSNTSYDFYVRAYCSATDISSWSLCETYTTFEAPVSIYPYENDFSNTDENNLWKFSTLNTQHSTINKWHNADSLYISSNEGVSATYKNKTTKTWVYRTFDMKAGVYTVSFDWKAKGDATDYMRVFMIPALSQFEEGSEIVYNFDGSVVSLSSAKQTFPKDWIDLGRDGSVFNSTPYWSNYSKTFMITPEMAGFYRFVVYWENDDVVNSNTLSAVIDNLIVEKSSCAYPYKIDIEDINSTYLSISWQPVGGTPVSYNVVALTQELNPDLADPKYVVFSNTVNTNFAKIENLTANTDYFIYVQANCDGGEDLSYWSDVYKFTTPCDPKPVGTIFSFELEEGYSLPYYENGEPNTIYRVPDCFVRGHANAEEFPFIKDNTVSYPHAYTSGIHQIARTGKLALKFYSNAEEKIGGYIALPLIDGNFDELQVSFWMRPFGAIKGTDNIDHTGLNAVFARKITVGTMTNPSDPTTFVPLQVLSYPYTTEDPNMAHGQFVYDDPEGHNYWRKHSVLLKGAKGKFIAFKNEMYDGKENNQMYIDDVVVDYVSDCMAPTSMMVEEATATTALLNATTNGATGYEVQLSLKEDFREIWRTDMIDTFPVVLTNLLSGQDYYIRARQVCGETNKSKWSSVANCITAYSTLYSTDLLGTFNTKSFTPRHWQRSCGVSATEIFEKTGSAMITDATNPLGWTVKDGHLVTYVTSFETRETNPYCWIFSPSIELPQGENRLMFNLALTDDDGVHKPDSTLSNIEDKFYVVVSEDNGRSWVESNKFVWANKGNADFDYNAIPYTGGIYELDLSKYSGKVIRLAFYSECRSAVTSQLHVNNIRINSIVNKEVKSVICETEDYRYDDFVKLSSELNVGENSFMYYGYASDVTQEDTIYNISVNVKPMSITSFNETLCSGDVYAQNNFKSLDRAGVYKQKLKSHTGCDSVVIVNLNVNPIPKVIFTDTICFGASYNWNGREYNRSGMYVDTLVSNITGCDSIVTLLLNVADAPIIYETVNICSGKTYQFGSQVITESGTYTETFKSASGCDSIVTLEVNIADDFRLILNEFMCPGETYSGHGFKGIPVGGNYVLPLTSVGGCDSTIVLNLMELSDDTIYVEQQITTNELPYTFASKVYDKNTKLGTYTDEIFVERGNCSSVVVLTLEVGEAVDVEKIDKLSDLTLYPNPVKVGDVINIAGDFTLEELDGMQVEIYTMLGSCIYSSQFSSMNSQLSIDDRGLYIVRVIAGNGNIYQGKIVVK